MLGSFIKKVESDDADLLKVINKRVKVEQQRSENENQLRRQAEALANQNSQAVNSENTATSEQIISSEAPPVNVI